MIPRYVTLWVPYPIDKFVMNLFPTRIEAAGWRPQGTEITLRIY